MSEQVFDPSGWVVGDRSTPDLEVEMASLASAVASLTARFLAVVGELDRRRVWAEQGCRSMAHYLSWKAALSLRTAQDHVRVAHALVALPVTAAALADGRISYSKARAITRMATPDTDGDLVELAVAAPAGLLDRIAAGYVTATSGDVNRVDDQHHRRGGFWQRHRDGSETLTVRFPADEAAVVRSALVVADGWVDEPDRASLAPARLAAAVVALAERVGTRAVTVDDGEPHAARVVVHADVEVLAGAPGRCRTGTGQHLHASVVRRLCCDAEIQLAMEDANGELIRFGRSRRVISRAMRRQLLRRDRRCRWPGCTERRHLQGHHLVEWVDGGPTDPDNIRMLCRFHHRFVHEGGCVMTVDTDGRVHVRHPSGWILASDCPIVVRAEDRAGTATTTLDNRWDGSHLDLGWTVGVLIDLQRWNQQHQRSAKRTAA